MLEKLNWRWIFPIVLLIGGFNFIQSSMSRSLSTELQARGVKTNGFLISKTMRTKSKSSIEYKYLVASQGLKTNSQELSHEAFRSVPEQAPFEVLYLPEDPEQAMIVASLKGDDLDHYLGLGTFLVGIIGTAYLGVHLYFKRKAKGI